MKKDRTSLWTLTKSLNEETTRGATSLLLNEEVFSLVNKQQTHLPRPMRMRATLLTLLSLLSKDGRQEVTEEKEQQKPTLENQ